ncbi:MAG: molybdopterin-dependent oxidoreductase [Acidobacteriota bacterium]
MSEDQKREILLEKVREFEKRTGHTTDSYPGDPSNTASVLREKRHLSEPLSPDEANGQIFARSRRTFITGGAAAVIGILGWRWMSDETKSDLYKKAFRFNERVSQIFYSPKQLAAEFTLDQVTIPARVNGGEGLEVEMAADEWRLHVAGLAGDNNDVILTLDDIKRLPRTEMVTQFKCIEGWSTIVHWAGVRFADFAAVYAPKNRDGTRGDVAGRPEALPAYVSLTTPDEKYFVGWDMPSILHPQTLLAYEMNGEPLKPENGAPLRLASPTKYGIKQIKRIGRIEFTDERPRDFWAQDEYGYDWYSGH